jgi:hypothetical protein
MSLAVRPAGSGRKVLDGASNALSIDGKRRPKFGRETGDEFGVLGSRLGQQRHDAITVTGVHWIAR